AETPKPTATEAAKPAETSPVVTPKKTLAPLNLKGAISKTVSSLESEIEGLGGIEALQNIRAETVGMEPKVYAEYLKFQKSRMEKSTETKVRPTAGCRTPSADLEVARDKEGITMPPQTMPGEAQP